MTNLPEGTIKSGYTLDNTKIKLVYYKGSYYIQSAFEGFSYSSLLT